MNINELLRMGNPQQALMNMLQSQSQSNPMMGNLFNLAKSNNTQGLKEIAKNMMKERGLDFNTEFSKFKKMYHL